MTYRETAEDLRSVLIRNGFVPCDIAACNCGSWHARYGLHERMTEVREALAEAGHPLTNDNGNLVIEALHELVAERDCLRSQVRAAQPDWPPMPETICLEQAAFREAGMFTQTHCVVTWVIADAHGAPMFRDRIGALICRSDDGELPIGPVKYWHLA